MFEPLNRLLQWKPPQQVEVIGQGLLPAGGKLVLAGEEGVFKTMFSTWAGFTISLGQPLLGFKTAKVKVGMLQSELPKAMFQKRIMKLVASHNPELLQANIEFATELEIKLNKPVGIAQLKASVDKLKPGLLIIDPLYKVLAADISDWFEMNKLCDNLDYISRTTGCSVWLVHHRRKKEMVNGEIIDLGSDELIGSSVLKNWADTIIRLETLVVDADVLRLSFIKARNSDNLIPPIVIKFDRSTLCFSRAIEEFKDIGADDLK